MIDSLLRNYYIPPVIFCESLLFVYAALSATHRPIQAVTTHDDGTQTRVCIDGKQRLTSIQL